MSVVVPFNEKPTCETCRFWFAYGTDKAALIDMQMRGLMPCNHPSVGGHIGPAKSLDALPQARAAQKGW